MNFLASDTRQLLGSSKPLHIGTGFASFSVINPQTKDSEALDNNKSSELKTGSDGSSSASDVSSSNVFRMIVVITGDSIVGFESERCFNEINWNDSGQLHIGIMPEIISSVVIEMLLIFGPVRLIGVSLIEEFNLCL